MSKLETVCYNIRSYFQECPRLSQCPVCHIPLEQKDLEASIDGQAFSAAASIPIVETSLYTCTQCGWWVIREMRLDCELGDGCVDYLIIPRPASGSLSALPVEPAPDTPSLWQKILADKGYWQNTRRLPARIAVLLFGRQAARDKTRTKHRQSGK